MRALVLILAPEMSAFGGGRGRPLYRPGRRPIIRRDAGEPIAPIFRVSLHLALSSSAFYYTAELLIDSANSEEGQEDEGTARKR